MVTREQFIIAARGLVGTPWKHLGRVPHVGTDCIGVGILTTRAVGIILPDVKGYSINPDGRSMYEYAEANLYPIHVLDALPADIVIMHYEASPRHVAILAEKNGTRTIIHATLEDMQVVEQTMSKELLDRVTRAYHVPGVE